MYESLSEGEHWIFVMAAYSLTFFILIVLFLHSWSRVKKNENQLETLRRAHHRDTQGTHNTPAPSQTRTKAMS